MAACGAPVPEKVIQIRAGERYQRSLSGALAPIVGAAQNASGDENAPIPVFNDCASA
jgi:hypothetical protein